MVRTSKTDQEAHGTVKALPYGRDPVTCPPCAYVRWRQVLHAWDTAADGAGRRAVLPVLRRQAATAAAGAGEELLHCCRSARLPEPVDPGRAVFPTVHKSGAVGVRAMSGDAIAEMIQRRAAAAGFTAARVQRLGGHSLRRSTTREKAGAPNPVTGKRSPGAGYDPSTAAHSESVLRGFYDFHLEAGTGPMVNPFPMTRRRGAGRAGGHHNPMDPFVGQRSGRYRPKVVPRVPRCIPDQGFDELFARLGSHRDRALVAFWVSTGARAAELLGATVGDVDPGQQVITVLRKGTRALQQVPASPDAFVWLRLYQAQLDGLAPAGRDQPLWWTLRKPLRALTYDAARVMFTRAAAALGANWSLHDLRHTAAYRMARDPQVSLCDVQWVLGHAHLSTTQRYLNPLTQDVIEGVLAFHARRAEHGPAAAPAVGYRPETLRVLFGKDAV